MVRHKKFGTPKLKEREDAIELRRQGLTYSEILKRVPVAKSTLSVWLGEVRLTTKQHQRITKKKKAAMLRGAQARRTQRIASSKVIFSSAHDRVGRISSRELWLLGIALYWGEGSKQREHNPSAGVMFANSDERMIKVFLCWLYQEGISLSSIYFELYIHSSRKKDTKSFQKFWAHTLNVPVSHISRVYYKKGNLQTNRQNTGDLYKGLLRIKVKASTDLNRMIAGAAEAITASVT